MAEKLFYSMGEVSEMFDVNPSLLRYWEEQFPMLKPKRNRKGNRHYTPQDLELIKTIYHLVKERGMKIEGAKRALREQSRSGEVQRNTELMERLQRIRALLEEVREDLKAEEGELISDEEMAESAPTIDKGGKAVVSIVEKPAEEEKPRVRRPRRKRDGEDKELFAFFEQSLF
ncbi:MAG: MerR family transcriptional regulator [Alistipes sp.]|nr:MerR family transcriptional regulator [Alistipes sp.]